MDSVFVEMWRFTYISIFNFPNDEIVRSSSSSQRKTHSSGRRLRVKHVRQPFHPYQDRYLYHPTSFLLIHPFSDPPAPLKSKKPTPKQNTKKETAAMNPQQTDAALDLIETQRSHLQSRHFQNVGPK
jgi:hypothetical protein